MENRIIRVTFDHQNRELGCIGQQGDHLYRQIEMDVSALEKELPGCSFEISCRRGEEEPYPIQNMIHREGKLLIPLTHAEYALCGNIYFQVSALFEDVVVSSAVLKGWVKASLIATGDAPESPYTGILAEFRQGLEKIEDIPRDIDAAMKQAKESGIFDGYTPQKNVDYWTEADKQEIAGDVEKIADRARDSAVQAENSAKEAKDSENQSSRNFQDFLSMLGNSVATLTGGKIPMEQIPATATVDIFEVTSEKDLVTLPAQKGDLGELIEMVQGERTITKVWQLLENDAARRENWVVWGTSYAVRSGHASASSHAADSDKINGMRLVTMNYSEFVTAVKDPDTLYGVDMEA